MWVKLVSRGLSAHKKLLLVHVRRHCYIEKSDHHLLISLVAPGHGGVRIRIVRIVARVVVPGHGAQPGSRLQRNRLGQSVAQLPVKMIVTRKRVSIEPSGRTMSYSKRLPRRCI